MSVRAENLVAEMHSLGVIFTASGPDADGLYRWSWEPRPESMRLPIRKVLRSVKERPPGSEMVAAIRQMQSQGSA